MKVVDLLGLGFNLMILRFLLLFFFPMSFINGVFKSKDLDMQRIKVTLLVSKVTRNLSAVGILLARSGKSGERLLKPTQKTRRHQNQSDPEQVL